MSAPDAARAERFRRLDALLDAALQHSAEERAGFLETACSGDAALHDELRALLAASDDAALAIGENIGAFADELLASLADDEPAPQRLDAGTRLGPWRVLRHIGHGGMGTVYLAERADGEFQMRVAIKLLTRADAGSELRRRFQAERRILGTLEHPNIARLLDGGTTADGAPYLVMQYIDGRPIGEWCDARRLDVAGRVALVRDVARAVHHAHRSLVVHRDVKPTNILVTEDGVPVLLDFGIARLLVDDGDDAPRTATGLHLLTPDYAAPEQLTGGPITTATDVHGLGAVLYELLTGCRPFAARGMGARLRAVMETVPQPPSSAALAAAALPATDPAAARRTTSARLRATLRGDLDTIVLRALAKEPDRRYASALQFADDLDRWLTGRPVLARVDTLGYRALRFAGRHRVGVAAGALALFLLLGAGIALTASAARTTRALRLAETERDRASQTAAFLQGLFSASDPYAARPDRLDTLRVPALLAIGAARAREQARLQPFLAADLMISIGRAYRGLGALDEAEPLLHEAAGLLRDDAADPRQLAVALNEAGVLLMTRRRAADAEPYFREALALRERTLPTAAPELLTTRMNLASALQDQDRFDEAIPLYDAIMTALRAGVPADSTRLAETLTARGTLAFRTGDIVAAGALLEEALAINRALLGDDHPRVARDLNNVAFLLDRGGRLADAEPLFRLSAELHERLLGAQHPMAALATTAYGDALGRLGRAADGRALFERALPVQRAAFGPASPDLALTLRQYAALLEAAGDEAAAEAAAAEGYTVAAAAHGADHVVTGTARARVARLACRRGAYEVAVAGFTKAARSLEQAVGVAHAATLGAHADHGTCLLAAGRPAEAGEVLAAAWAAVGPDDNGDGPIPAADPRARVAAALADVYEATGRSAEAERLKRRLQAGQPGRAGPAGTPQ